MNRIVRIVTECVKEETSNPALHNGINGVKPEEEDLPDEEYNDEDGQGDAETELLDVHGRWGETVDEDFGAGGAAAGASSPKPPSRSTSWTGAAAGFAGAAGADADAIRALGAREVVAAVRLDVDAERDGPSS